MITPAQLKTLTDSLDNFIKKVTAMFNKRSLHVSVDETVSIAAGGTKTYDLKALMGTDVFVKFDVTKALIVVRVKDPDANSPTKDSFINAEAVMTVAVRGTQYVDIINRHTAALSTMVRISVPEVPAA